MSDWTPGRATHTPIIPGRKRARPIGVWAAVLLGAAAWACAALVVWGGWQVVKAILELAKVPA